MEKKRLSDGINAKKQEMVLVKMAHEEELLGQCSMNNELADKVNEARREVCLTKKKQDEESKLATLNLAKLN